MGLHYAGGSGGGGGGGVSAFSALTGTAPVVQSVIYAGDLAAARPTANVVVWQGFPSQPTNVGANDLWLDADSGASLLTGTTAPTTEGVDGDIYIRTGASAAIYGPKASGAWPTGTSLIGAAGTNGTNGTNGSAGAAGRGITSITRTAGTGAAGTTDTYTITYSDSTTSTFNVVNGADGAGGGAITVQDEGTPLTTAATTLNFVGAGVTATGTGAAKTVTIPGGSSSALAPTAQTTTYTAAANDLVLANATGGAFTVTLPTPTSGVRIAIKKTDSSTNAVTVATTSGTLDGASTRTLPVQHAAQVYVADGTNWFRIDVPAVTALAATGTPSSTTYLRGDGSWSTPAGGSSRPVRYTMPSGAIGANLDRFGPVFASLVPTSGTVYYTAIELFAGETVTTIYVRTGNGGFATVTNSWAALLDSSRTVLAVSATDTTTTAANTKKGYALGTPYVVPTSGLYYVALMWQATTISVWGMSTLNTAGQLTEPPILAGTGATAQTTPPSVASTMTAITPSGSIVPYAWFA